MSDPNIPVSRIEGALLYGAAAGAGPKRETLFIEANEIRPPHMSDGPRLAADGLLALPGFIDLHVHGGGGGDAMQADPEALQIMGRLHLEHGTTSLMPTTVTAPLPNVEDAVLATAAAMSSTAPAPRILGVHVEGPFISPRYPGAQNPRYIREPELDFVDRLMDTGVLKLMTVAPEIPGGEALVRRLRAGGAVAVSGHTAASYVETAAGAAWGIRQATHTYNAMRGLHHREPGALGWILQDQRIFAQLIADNVHVHPGAMRLLARCKTMRRLLLITDAISATGRPEGIYRLGELPVEVRNGECRLPDGTLAGSVLTMERGLANLVAATGLPLAECWPASSLTAAESCGWGHRLGRLAPGYIADIVLLTQDLEVAAVLVDGRLRHIAEEFQERLVA